jgi:hypothetical protein
MRKNLIGTETEIEEEIESGIEAGRRLGALGILNMSHRRQGGVGQHAGRRHQLFRSGPDGLRDARSAPYR